MKITNMKKYKQPNIIMFTLMLIFLIKGVFYAVYITPLSAGTSPDDIGHISYIQYIASEKKLPVLFDANLENVTSQSQISYFQHNTTNLLTISVEKKEQFDKKNGYNWIVQHPPLYYLIMTPIYLFTELFTNNFHILLLALRLATILFGMASIYVMDEIMDLLQTKDVVRYCILVCFVFFAPMQYFYSNVTNDSLLIFLCILTLFFLLKYTKEKLIKNYYFFVISCGLVMMTKYTGALVLISYIAYFLYKSVKEDGIKQTIKLCVLGLLIGGAIVASVFIRNYILYGNSVQLAADPNENLNYQITFYQFIKDKNYLDTLYTFLITFIGARNFIYATSFMKWVVAILVAILSFLCSLNDNNKNRQLLINIMGIITGIILLRVLDLELSLCIASISFIILSFNLLTSKEMNAEKKEINWFFFVTILVVFLIFMLEQYKASQHYGYVRAVQGRYYYIVAFPFLYLLFNILEEYEFKYTKYFPVLLTIFLMLCEAKTIILCLGNW